MIRTQSTERSLIESFLGPYLTSKETDPTIQIEDIILIWWLQHLIR